MSVFSYWSFCLTLCETHRLVVEHILSSFSLHSWQASKKVCYHLLLLIDSKMLGKEWKSFSHYNSVHCGAWSNPYLGCCFWNGLGETPKGWTGDEMVKGGWPGFLLWVCRWIIGSSVLPFPASVWKHWCRAGQQWSPATFSCELSPTQTSLVLHMLLPSRVWRRSSSLGQWGDTGLIWLIPFLKAYFYQLWMRWSQKVVDVV